MFPLHESTRLALCRMGFLCLCVLPTFVVAAAAWHYRSPAYLEARREEWMSVLGDQLGVDVEIGRLTYPTWNSALLEDVVVRDPETSETIASARVLEVVRDDTQWQVVAEQPEIMIVRLPLLVDVLHERLLRGRAMRLAPLRFETSGITFQGPEQSQTFCNVSGELVTTETGKQASLTFNVAGEPDAKPITFAAERRRDESHAVTHCRFQTSDVDLPCAAFAPLFPWIAELGDEAVFSGDVEFERRDATTSIGVAGKFRNVDLQRLVTHRFPRHHLTGRAEIAMDRIILRNGGITEAKGTLLTEKGGGQVSRTLLDSFGKYLSLTPTSPPKHADERLVAYSRMAFGFQLDSSGLSLNGGADPARDGVIMAGVRAGALLEDPTGGVIPAVALLRALSPESEVQIPATQQTKPLLDLFPVPSLLPANAQAQARPNLNLKLNRKR